MIPLLLIGFGWLALVPVRSRKPKLAALAEIALSLGALAWLLFQQTAEFSIPLWASVAGLGPGFDLRLDFAVWPYVVLGAVLLAREQISGSARPHNLLIGVLILAAILSGNLLTAVVLWTLLPVVKWSTRTARAERMMPAIVAIIPLSAAASPASTEAGFALIAAAALMRAWSVESESSLMEALPGLSLLARFAELEMMSTVVVALGALGLVGGFLRGSAAISLAVLGAALLGIGLAGGQAETIALTALVVLVIVHVAQAVGRVWSAAGSWAAALGAAGLATIGAAVDLSAGEAVLIVGSAALIAAQILQNGVSSGERRAARFADWVMALMPILVIGVVSVRTELRLSLTGVIHAAIAFGLGAAVWKARTLVSQVRNALQVLTRILERLQLWIHEVMHAGSTAIRAITGLFEGESGVIWMFLLLLIAILGLQGGST